MGATVALLSRQQWGYGSGVVPTSNDMWVAKSGMSTLNYDPNNGYVANYMFSLGFEVHSVLGDMWIRYGLLGAIFALVAVGVCVHAVASRLSLGLASAPALFLTANAVWDLLFTPILTASYTLVLAFALAVLPKPRHLAPASPSAPPHLGAAP